MEDIYKTIEKNSKGFFKDKGSKFYSFAFPVNTEDEIKNLILKLKKEHHGARHHCYAWRVGMEEITYRTNDDGEPSSTAGKPILGQLLHFDLTNTLIIVVRYFGGTLLGTSGLINAYKSAAADALNNAIIITKFMVRRFKINFEYPVLNDIMNIIKQENYQIESTDFKENCTLIFNVRRSEAEKAFHIFEKLYGVEIKSLE